MGLSPESYTFMTMCRLLKRAEIREKKIRELFWFTMVFGLIFVIFGKVLKNLPAILTNDIPL